MRERGIWPVCVDANHAISRYYVPVMDETAAEYQLPEGGGWMLLPALAFDPGGISAEKLRIRSPYTSARRFEDGLEILAAKGFLVDEPGMSLAYRLSPAGRAAIMAVIQAGYDCMATLKPLEISELETLASTLYRLVKACLDAPEPPGKWSITHSRRIDPGEGAAVMVRIDQYLSDLAAYRDDSHLAAWQIHEIDAHAWEVLTILWCEEGKNIDDILLQTARRGFLPGETQLALDDLVERGWIQLRVKTYQLTPLGEDIRKTAEDETDRTFYRPWSCLNDQEMSALLRQLTSLKDALQAGWRVDFGC